MNIFAVMKAQFLFLFLFASLYASCLTDHLLQGKIGKAVIYMSLEEYSDDKRVMGRYFYRASLKDIVVEGEKTGNRYVLYVHREDKKFGEKFTLSKNADGSFKGEWESGKGKKLAVELNPVKADATKNPNAKFPAVKKLKTDEPLNYIRSAFLKFQYDSITTMNGKTFEWYSETHCSMKFFRIANGYDSITRKRINAKLEDLHVAHAVDQLSCATSWNYNEGNGIDFVITITYADEKLLGFEVSRSYFCGGAHPDFDGQGHLLDLATGKSYELKDIITCNANQLVTLLLAEKAFGKTAEGDDCDYDNEDYWSYPEWMFTEKGIYVTPYFYRAARSCQQAFLLPFDALEQYKHPAFPYQFPQ